MTVRHWTTRLSLLIGSVVGLTSGDANAHPAPGGSCYARASATRDEMYAAARACLTSERARESCGRSGITAHRSAEEIPAFARKYGMRCSACHFAAPLLNPYGQAFKDNGYSVAPTPATPDRAARRRAPIVVRMLGDAKGYRFEPASVKARAGDVVRFVNVSGGPHNVSFWQDSIPAGAAGQLQRNMGLTMSPLNGVMITQPDAEYLVSIAKLPTGAYQFYCLPHLALRMRGQIVVQP